MKLRCYTSFKTSIYCALFHNFQSTVQVGLVIRGLFICKFVYLRLIKIQYLLYFGFANSQFFDKIRHKNQLKWSFIAIQCSLIIRGFNIGGTLTERISTANYEGRLCDWLGQTNIISKARDTMQ